MRIKLVLNSERGFIPLPIHHNKHIQAMLYRNLPGFLAKFLHDIGFLYEGKKFKLFTFSKIFSERFRIKDGKIYYNTPIEIYISSAIEDITESLGNSVISRDFIQLEKNRLYMQTVEIVPKPSFNAEVKIRTLSPITVYKTTIQDINGIAKKYTKYFEPNDQDFKELIRQNIIEKFFVITGKKLENFEFDIIPLGNYRIVPMKYMDTFIKAVEGNFKIKTNQPEVIEKVYDAGLGSKNSQGFGMIEIMSE